MIPLADLAAHFKRIHEELRPAMEAEMHVAMEGVAEVAKGMIGHEMPGWDPLSASTVAEKERLGYVGRISPTDPLLRTGELENSLSGEAIVERNTIVGVVGSTSDHSIEMELGSSRVPPRPFIMPALIVSSESIGEAFCKLALRALVPGRKLI